MSHLSEFVTLQRDVEGLLIPSGTPILLPSGVNVQITQALGNSLTLYFNGNLIRLYGHDADAVGRQPPQIIERDFTVEQLTEADVMKALRNIFDPEIPVNIVDLGLIYDVIIQDHERGKFINVKMTLTAPGCGMGPILAQDVESVCKKFPGVFDAHIDVVFDPPWNQEMMSEEARLTLGLI